MAQLATETNREHGESERSFIMPRPFSEPRFYTATRRDVDGVNEIEDDNAGEDAERKGQ